MELGLVVDQRHPQAQLGIVAQSRRPAGAPTQSSTSAPWLSTFTCGYWGKP